MNASPNESPLANECALEEQESQGGAPLVSEDEARGSDSSSMAPSTLKKRHKKQNLQRFQSHVSEFSHKTHGSRFHASSGAAGARDANEQGKSREDRKLEMISKMFER